MDRQTVRKLVGQTDVKIERNKCRQMTARCSETDRQTEPDRHSQTDRQTRLN